MSRSATGPRIDPSLLRGLVVAGIGGVVLALTGPFQTGEVPLGSRLVYWMPIMLAAGLWGHLCATLVDRFVTLDGRPWLKVLAMTVVISGPLTLFVWAATGLFFTGQLPSPGTLPDMLVAVVILTATVSMINVFLTLSRPVQTHAAAIGQASARFPDRLPFKLRGAAIHAVPAEDHYLRIHTDRGSDLILMRLSDALDELEGLEGAQTHRSWRVARDAVLGVARGDGRATLTLDGGVSAPVSRRYARALRAAGWY